LPCTDSRDGTPAHRRCWAVQDRRLHPDCWDDSWRRPLGRWCRCACRGWNFPDRRCSAHCSDRNSCGQRRAARRSLCGWGFDSPNPYSWRLDFRSLESRQSGLVVAGRERTILPLVRNTREQRLDSSRLYFSAISQDRGRGRPRYTKIRPPISGGLVWQNPPGRREKVVTNHMDGGFALADGLA
jgi:hypothetical protein